MIETRAALDALDEILGVEGVDGVFVGPSDLSIALQRGLSVEPRGAALMTEARRVAERAKAHGKYAAMFCFDGADARAMLALGFRAVLGLQRPGAAARRGAQRARDGARRRSLRIAAVTLKNRVETQYVRCAWMLRVKAAAIVIRRLWEGASAGLTG